MSKKSKILKVTIILSALLVLIFGFEVKSQVTLNPLAAPTQSTLPAVNLKWWVVWENPSDFNILINNFKSVFPHVQVEVKKFRYSEYKDALIRAWAKDEGPDIFSIPNTWLREYEEWIETMPEQVTLEREEASGGPGCFRKVKVVDVIVNLLRVSEISQKFVSQVEKDIIWNNQIWGVPLNFDSLVLYYNRDLLDAAKIPLPPANWEEFSDQVRKLTKVDKNGNIFQAGAALGTSNNLERSSDILSLLMMQVGAQMSDSNNYATFNQARKGGKAYFPAEEALRFYTDFQNKDKEVYTWHKDMPQAIEMFSQGKLAFLFGYLYHLPTIRNQAPNLNFDIAKMPQPTGAVKEINFTNYQVQVVAKKSKNKDFAWALLKQASTKPQDYLNRTSRLTTLRELINEQLQNPDLEVFASQALNSFSWYHGKNPLLMEEAFAEMINKINQGQTTYQGAINFAVEKINRTIK